MSTATQNELDRDGVFRVTPQTYGLWKAESGAVAINLECLVESQWMSETQEWQDWRQYGDYVVKGPVWVIKKDGSLNQKAIDSLIEHAGWDGDLLSISNQTWTPKPCQVVVNEQFYNGQSKGFQVSFVNGWDQQPGGGFSNVSTEIAKALQTQHGAALRALAANKRQQAKPAPQGRPPARATTAKGAIQKAVEETPLPEERPGTPTGEIPF